MMNQIKKIKESFVEKKKKEQMEWKQGKTKFFLYVS